MCRDPSTVVKSRRPPATTSAAARRSGRSRAREVRMRRSAARSSRSAAPSSASMRSSHAWHRIRLVETQDVVELAATAARAPPPPEVREDELAPMRVRARGDAPVRRAIVDDLAALLDARQQVAAGARRMSSPSSAPGRRRRERRSAPPRASRERQHAPAVPRGHEVERVLIRVDDAGALDPTGRSTRRRRTSRPGRRRCRDGSRQLLLAELGGDQTIWPDWMFAPWTASSARRLQRSPIRQAILYLAANTME